MRAPTQFLSETHIIGRDCRQLMIDSEHVPILRKVPFIWVGFSVLRPPYRIVRLRSVHSHVLATVSGTGRTLIDGQAVDCNPGQVLVAPVGQHHGFEVKGRGPWTIAWIFFDDTEAAPALPGKRPELRQVDSSDFTATVKLLTHETSGAAQPSVVDALVTVLEAATRRLVGVEPVDQRLWPLWSRVEQDLGKKWTVTLLAKTAAMSEEHLRRLCQKNYQRSPFDYLTHLRMRRASTLLRSSRAKLEDVALGVGYSSVYSFSAAFSRWSGVSPGRFRRQVA